MLLTRNLVRLAHATGRWLAILFNPGRRPNIPVSGGVGWDLSVNERMIVNQRAAGSFSREHRSGDQGSHLLV